MFALVDCNNFYASCERVFQPKLENRPVVVLSNNDGCIIARSNEAKKLGIGMGVPFFEVRPIVERYGVAVRSSNYELYGDMSSRVMQTLMRLASDVEIYSIDEALRSLRLSTPGSRRLRLGNQEYGQALDGHTGRSRHRAHQDASQARQQRREESGRRSGA
jgi:nucleotidyltransferase/DNA polymerase involved in DNA repair